MAILRCIKISENTTLRGIAGSANYDIVAMSVPLKAFRWISYTGQLNMAGDLNPEVLNCLQFLGTDNTEIP